MSTYVPANYSPASTGCTAAGCGTQETTTLSHLGRRCSDHPPRFEPDHAVEILTDGWPETAMAYVRWAP